MSENRIIKITGTAKGIISGYVQQSNAINDRIEEVITDFADKCGVQGEFTYDAEEMAIRVPVKKKIILRPEDA